MERNISTIPFNAGDSASVRKIRRKRQRSLVRNICYEYTQSTSLQGIPYFTKRGLTSFEKIFWMITFVVSLSMCSYLIRDVWIKWKTSPVIVTVSEQLVPVMKVPLPSITICPQARCMATVYNYTKEMNRMLALNSSAVTSDESEKFEGVSLMCGDHKKSRKTMQHILYSYARHRHRFLNASAVKYMNEVALDYNDIFISCEVNKKHKPCSELFSKVLTATGICYTMNALSADEIFRKENLQKDFLYMNTEERSQNWSMEHGYDGNLLPNSSAYPERGMATNEEAYVYILFRQILEDHDQFCNGYGTGLNAYINHPADLPQTSLLAYSMMNDEDSLLALSFNIMNTSESLRSYDPQTRQCYFPEDKQLKYFKIYTAKNCRIECLADFIFEECKCVRFHMPHNTSNRICTLKHRQCWRRAQANLAHRESNEESKDRCQCLPACNSIDYDASFLRNAIDFKKVLSSEHTSSPNFTKTKYARLKIFYKSPRFISMRRSELYGITDFLAACGGLLSLFLGFSFLSIAEVLYFSTLRVCCALKEDRKQDKEEAKQNLDQNEKF